MTTSTLPTRVSHPTSDRCSLSLLVSGNDGQRQQPWVLFVHGFAAEATEGGLFADCMAALEPAGFASASYDWRGLGESHGDFARSTLQHHVDDFRSVLGWVRRQAGARGQIHVIGFSLGCTVVALGLAGEMVSSCILLSPALRPRVSMWPRYNTERCRVELRQTGFLVKAENGVRIGRPMLEDLRRTDLHSTALNSQWPYLICHGSGDQRIPMAETRHLLAQNPRVRVRFEPFAGASHSFRPAERHRPRLYRLIRQWLAGDFRSARPQTEPGPPRGRRPARELLPT